MKRILISGLIALMCGGAYAGNGETAGTFLTFPAGARSAAMGEGGLGLAVDGHALFLNPASMAGLESASVVGTHGAYIDSSYFDQIAYVNPRSKGGAWGVGLQYFNSGKIEGMDINGNPTNGVTPNDMALTGSYARKTGPVRWGAGLKYVQSKLVDTASTFSLDAGVESLPLMNKKVTMGAVVQNMGGSLKYDKESNDLPMLIKAGGGYAVTKDVDLAADATFPKEGDSFFSVGGEYRWSKLEPWTLALRGGYTTRTKDVDGMAGLTMGMGVTHKNLTVDYAFLPFGDIGSTHWITLGYAFSN